MNNSISNPKVEVPMGTKLNDKDYLNALLGTLKEMVKNYAIALTEASNEVLYNKYKDMFNRYSDMQRSVFELMFKKGWYCLEKAEDTKLQNKYNMLNTELVNLKI